MCKNTCNEFRHTNIIPIAFLLSKTSSFLSFSKDGVNQKIVKHAPIIGIWVGHLEQNSRVGRLCDAM